MSGEGHAAVGAASRSLAALVIDHTQGAIKAYHAQNFGDNALQESWQQYQVPISGFAGSVINWTRVSLDFAMEFHDATSQRNVPFNYPTMLQGVEIQTANPVIVSACVMSWKRQKNNAIRGATIAVGAFDPTTNGVTPFKGFLHLMFEGYGAPVESFPEEIP